MILAERDLDALKPTERFSERVENYISYRPGYPDALFELMRREMKLAPASVIADVGCGSGLLARPLLERGGSVYGVEPNREMREAAGRLLKDFPNFHSVEGTAEATTLSDSSVDLITAGQAFHWFEMERAGAEFRRILKPGGYVALVWNDRRRDSTPFLRDYERLLVEFSSDYSAVAAGYMLSDEKSHRILLEFFGGDYRTARFDNFQNFNRDGLRGRLLSASYAPMPGEQRYELMMAELSRIFDAHQQGGQVIIEYDTNVYYGTLR